MITDIQLENFRSYKDASFELSTGVNIIVGPNGSGKTNLLEAVLVSTLGRSYRAKDSELLQFDKTWARLKVHTTVNSERTIYLEAGDNGVIKKQFKIDGKVYQRLSMQKNMPTIIFEPNDLLIIGGGPEQRRRYMDNILEQTIVGFGSTRRQYQRTLYQRNALLKSGKKTGSNQLFVWNVRISELGAKIVQNRQKLITEINARCEELYKSLSKTKDKLSFAYNTDVSINNYASDLLKKLEKNENLDFERGFTSGGPHRDDLKILFNKKILQPIASRGEVRTTMLLCKIVELQMVEKERGQKPILLLDDVFSELDGARRQALVRYLKNYQTFITTTDADAVVNHFNKTVKNIIPTTRKH